MARLRRMGQILRLHRCDLSLGCRRAVSAVNASGNPGRPVGNPGFPLDSLVPTDGRRRSTLLRPGQGGFISLVGASSFRCR
jgi:hypothetical protein